MSFPFLNGFSSLSEVSIEYILAICMICVTTMTVIVSWLYSPAEPNKATKLAATEPTDSDREGLLTKMKRNRQEEIASQVTAGMSSEQLQEEKKIEEEQLAAIYSLLSEQGNKFNVSSMEEVQDQLKLYRP